jgi:hypothetical protein
MSFAKTLTWLASYNRDTGSLSTEAAKHCGYGDAIRFGYVVNRGTSEMPDLFITATGKSAVAMHSSPIRNEWGVKATGNS